MEDRLANLIEGNSETNRIKWALEWKKKGKKVIGTLCSYVPEEVLYAAGMLPWRITGTWQPDVSKALAHRPMRSRLYYTHVLESLLSGELDFLDGVVATDREQELVRLWDVWTHFRKIPFTHIMHVPHHDSELCLHQLERETSKFIGAIEDFTGLQISKQSLQYAISVLNKTRDLLMKLYELRKREVPPLSGAETLGIVTSATIMPKDEFNRELESLLPYLDKRKTSLSKLRPRLLVSSDMLDNPAYISLVEEVGCLVAMDDMDPGSRYFWRMVDTDGEEPIAALAERYIARPGCSRMTSWDKQAAQVVGWVKEFNVDAVLELPEMYSIPCGFRTPYLVRKLNDAGIPFASFKREYHMGATSQLRTRVGGFLETLEG